MVNQSAYFDLYDVWVNELVGDILLFVIVGLLVVIYLSIKTNMPYQLTILFSSLWVLVVFSVATETLLIMYILTILVIGGGFYYIYSKLLRRG